MPTGSQQVPIKNQNPLAKQSIQDRLQTYCFSHIFALFSSLGRQLRSPFTWAMTTLVIAIALALTGGFYCVVKNLQQLTGNIDASNQISLFLKQDINESSARVLVEKLAGKQQIKSANYISRKQALEEFREYSGFGDALNTLDENPLPPVIQVFPDPETDAVAMSQLITELQRHQQVDFAQIDMQWLQRLQSFMQLAQRAIELLSVLIGSAVIFITGNTIRLELQNRKDEVLIAKLVGASDSYIRRPFLYSGFWYGFFAGIVAWMLITIMLLVLQGPVSKLARLYAGDFSLLFLSGSESLTLLLIASGLGVLGAWSVLVFQLNEIRPE